MSSSGGGGGGGGGTLLLFYTYVGSGYFFGVQNFEFQYFWGFSKNNFFGGMKILWTFFGGSPQNWPIFRGHFYAF